MKNQNCTKIALFHLFSSRHFSCRFSFAAEPIKSRPLRFGKIEKMVTVLIIVGILVVSAFGFLMQAGEPYSSPDKPVKNNPTATSSPSDGPSPTEDTSIPPIFPSIIPGNPPSSGDSRGIFEKSSVMNSTAWHQVAVYAWNYFQPGQGLDSTTGLPAGSWGWNYFTDWDLGVYIQAVIDAQKMNLVSPDAQNWGSSIRLEKVVQFLETRPLLTDVTTRPPYWFYSSSGDGYMTQNHFDVVDTGTLLVSLYNLKMYNASLSDRIDNFVYNTVENQEGNRTDYTSVISQIKAEDETSTSIYAYYLTAGFAKFFPELEVYADKVLDNINNAPTITTYGVALPKSTLTCEPLLYSYFYLNSNPKLTTILNQVYDAHEAKYESTGEFVAYSEGNYKSGDDFIYEWVVLPNGDTWKITRAGSSEYVEDVKPVIYTSVAVSFLSVYNSTFAKDMCIYLEKESLSPDNGFYFGAVYNSGSNKYSNNIGCNTNGLILAAARYASQ